MPRVGTLIAERSAELAVRLVAEGARFVIVGSTARRLRGAGVCPGDLDVAVTPQDLPNLAQPLATLGAHLGPRLPNAGPVTVHTPWGPLDVFVTEALPPAETVTVHGVRLEVARV